MMRALSVNMKPDILSINISIDKQKIAIYS